MKLSIVIVNYKVPKFLLQVLDAVYSSIRDFEMEVLVVDNASSDNSLELLRKHFLQVEYIQNTENLGFAKANNIAIKKATGDYVLLLNPDVIISEHCLQEICDFADGAQKFGALGVRMIDKHGSYLKESKRGIPTLWASFTKMSGLSSYFPKSKCLTTYYAPLSSQKTGEVAILSGAFMLLNKKELGNKILLDERYFMYGEDVDLSYTILKQQYKNYYLPHTIVHYKGESTSKNSTRYVKVFYHAMLLYYQKYHKNTFAYPLVYLAVKLMTTIGLFMRLFYRKNKYEQKEEELVLSTSTCSYAEIIQHFEQNSGDKKIIVYHPKFDMYV